MLKRKVDLFLKEWRENINRKPLIISGARQIGKTTSIREFGKTYKSFIEINFITMPQYKTIFNNGYEVKNIIKEMSLFNPKFNFIDNNTLILFDEIQEYPDATTSLKTFSEDGRFDVICSGSLLGVNYKKIRSIPVGFKEEYTMYSMDFEEYLWANGYDESQIDDIYSYMKELKPLPETYFNVLKQLYRDYIFIGGMPEAVNLFIENGTFSKPFNVQKRIYKDYEDDITNTSLYKNFDEKVTYFPEVNDNIAQQFVESELKLDIASKEELAKNCHNNYNKILTLFQLK